MAATLADSGLSLSEMLPEFVRLTLDKTAGNLADLGRDDIFISNATYHYDGGGCC